MARSQLFGRRIHIAGSVSIDPALASDAEVKSARAFVEGLVQELVRRGAMFVLPVDAEKRRCGDELPVCFDWLIWQTIHANLAVRPADSPDPLVVAVQHHKNEAQVPAEFEKLWDDMRGSDLVRIENVSHWNMNTKRMEAQARWGDILIVLGGAEGVLFLANLYHEAGKPVVPLNYAITRVDAGARRVFSIGLSRARAQHLFRTGDHSDHTWINRINFTGRHSTADRVRRVIELLEALEPPTAFVIRLLNPDHEDYADVDAFFESVVRPVVENELGYKLSVIDGRQPYEHARIDEEIFARLHRSSFVLADITGMRPNCFLELGYALGRGLPTLLMAKHGSSHPFDIHTFAGLHWKTMGSLDDRRKAFREHWTAVRNRPPLVSMEPLIL